MSNIYFTSDLHFNHNQPFIYFNRGFSNVGEHDANLIFRINERVTEEDELYVLGDFALGVDCKYIKNIIDMINCCNIHLIIGNHDSVSKINNIYDCSDKFVEVVAAKYLKYKKKVFYLSHYPSITSNFTDQKAPWSRVWNLYGHTHSSDKYEYFEKMCPCYNVAVDAHDGYPVEINEIILRINNNYRW